MRKTMSMFIVSFSMFDHVSAHTFSDFTLNSIQADYDLLKTEKKVSLFNLKSEVVVAQWQQQELSDFDLNLEQKQQAEAHEQEIKDYTVLNQKLYENDRLQVFNYTAYNSNDIKSVLLNTGSDMTLLNGLTISIGYGISFKLDQNNKIGYEYLSSFPYDRGQMIRFFWLRSLRY